MAFSYDTWGGSWGSSWGNSWGGAQGQDSNPRVRDLHLGRGKRQGRDEPDYAMLADAIRQRLAREAAEAGALAAAKAAELAEMRRRQRNRRALLMILSEAA